MARVRPPRPDVLSYREAGVALKAEHDAAVKAVAEASAKLQSVKRAMREHEAMNPTRRARSVRRQPAPQPEVVVMVPQTVRPRGPR